MHVVCVHHLDPPALGFARAALERSGARVTHVSPYRGDQLPGPEQVDAAIVFGAEQSVLDLERDPVMQAESRWVRALVEREVPLLGICFGGQLLARALGGSVARLDRRLLTWDPIALTDAGVDDLVLGALPAGARALHWNQDGFEPPPGAVELIAGRGARGVGFRVGACAWGVQFHPEVDGEILERWYAGWPGAVAEAGTTEGAARAADAVNLPAQAATAAAVFDRFLAVAREHRGGDGGASAETETATAAG